MTRPADLVRKNTWFPIETWIALKREAIRKELSPSEFINEVLTSYLSTHIRKHK